MLHSDALCHPVHAGISAVPTPFLDKTIAFWQPYYGRPLSREDAREIIHNVSGFFAVLAEWEKSERVFPKDETASPVKTQASQLCPVSDDDAQP
ncbi:hypothetical protein NP284_32765 [Rhodopseudomonas pseudopalustris]